MSGSHQSWEEREVSNGTSLEWFPGCAVPFHRLLLAEGVSTGENR